MTRERYQIRWKLQHTIAEMNYLLECFGDYLAQENDYPKGIDGFDAVYLYLANKHHWTIEQCRSMSKEDIRLVLSEEMKGWTVPLDARFGSNSFE